jgi:hypothetical protein
MALFDRLDGPLQDNPDLRERMWQRREIENYLCQPETLIAYAESSARHAALGPLFEQVDVDRHASAMREAIEDLVPPVALRDPADRWWLDTKASDDFLDRLFAAYYASLELPNLMLKSDYHQLAKFVPPALIAPEVSDVLDAIHAVARAALGA